jgi:magnesium-transporting ATPase (P-type)
MNEKENGSLLSGIYFVNYKRVLKIVLPAVAILTAFANILTISLNHPDNIGSFTFLIKTIGQTIGVTICGIWVVYGIITFIFTILERSKALTNVVGPQHQYTLNLSYTKIVTNLAILAGVILVVGIVICLILYYKINENIASIVFIIIMVISCGLYVALTIILLKHLKKTSIDK